MHRTYIGGIERGERNPSYTALLTIAEGLEIDVARWVERAAHA
jgi:transcriptional regulator with XRE-family HTH domain